VESKVGSLNSRKIAILRRVNEFEWLKNLKGNEVVLGGRTNLIFRDLGLSFSGASGAVLPRTRHRVSIHCCSPSFFCFCFTSPSRPGLLAVASRSPHRRVQVASPSRSFRVTVALVLRHRRVSVAPPSRSCRLCLAWPSSTPRLVVGSSDRRVSSPLVVGSRLSFSTGFFSFSCDHHFYFTISIFF